MRSLEPDTGWENAGWTRTRAGHGEVTQTGGRLALTNRPTPPRLYSNAQVSDYDYETFAMRWGPPLRMAVTAQASGGADNLRGTAGFGFWNHPLSPGRTRRVPRLPKAVWFFFGSPPGGLNLAYGGQGAGWKAMTLDLTRLQALALAPLALPVVVLNQFAPLYRRIWPPLQRILRVSERVLSGDLLAERHTYELEWRASGVTFRVDGAVVHTTPTSPSGGMGFVAWIDNQFMRVSPRGAFAWGLLPLDTAQTLWLDEVHLEVLD